MKLTDEFGRQINYLRISITDRCNLNCHYCAPLGIRHDLPHREILTYEEILKVVKAGVRAGITKVRLTGGEPLIRKGIVEFCRMLNKLDGLESITLTTNGVLLEQLAEPLFEAGVRRINISLDTLKPDRFRKITGQEDLDRVLSGIEKAREVGFNPIKINTVVMRGVNDSEINDLARLTLKKPYHVRFIELMPMQNCALGDHASLFMPVPEIIRLIDGIDKSQLGPAVDSFGPARICTLPGGAGTVGFIAPLSWHFCSTCNRLRLTADGRLRPCLFSEKEIDIKGPLRAGASMNDLIEIFKAAVARKIERHRLDTFDSGPKTGRGMYAIGG